MAWRLGSAGSRIIMSGWGKKHLAKVSPRTSFTRQGHRWTGGRSFSTQILQTAREGGGDTYSVGGASHVPARQSQEHLWRPAISPSLAGNASAQSEQPPPPGQFGVKYGKRGTFVPPLWDTWSLLT